MTSLEFYGIRRPGNIQEEYKKPYFILFNGVTDALTALKDQNYGLVKSFLTRAQQQAEEAFISGDEDTGKRE